MIDINCVCSQFKIPTSKVIYLQRSSQACLCYYEFSSDLLKHFTGQHHQGIVGSHRNDPYFPLVIARDSSSIEILYNLSF